VQIFRAFARLDEGFAVCGFSLGKLLSQLGESSIQIHNFSPVARGHG